MDAVWRASVPTLCSPGNKRENDLRRRLMLVHKNIPLVGADMLQICDPCPSTCRDGWAQVRHLPDIPASSAAMCARLAVDSLPYFRDDTALITVQSVLAAYHTSGGVRWEQRAGASQCYHGQWATCCACVFQKQCSTTVLMRSVRLDVQH